MKTRITDLVQNCCPADIELGRYDRDLTARILENVQGRLGMNPSHPRRIRKVRRILLLAAVLALAFATAAYAIAEYTIRLRKPAADEDLLAGFRYEEVVDGKVWNSEVLVYPDAGMVFTFSCPDEMTRTPEFRCFWLPQDATEGITDEQGWTKRLFCDAGDSIPYCITTFDSIRDGSQYVLNGDVELVKEEQLEDWQILEVTSDYSRMIHPAYERANYILLFEKTTGFLVLVSGESDMETLEHIVYEMEIRESDVSPVAGGGSGIGLMDLGRG